jgi:tetratricopeptide (TPR) repeat protein
MLICGALTLLSFQVRLDYANYLLAQSGNQSGKEAIESVLRAGIVDSRGGFYDAVAALKIDQLSNGSADKAFLLRAADNHYRRELDLNPWSPQIIAAYGDFLIRAGRPCEAIATLERSVSLDFYFSLSHFNLANAYASCRSSDQAATEAGIAILTTPTLAYSTEWRNNPIFLERALDESWKWISVWKTGSSPEDGEKRRRLEDFVRAVRAAPHAGQVRVKIALSEQVAAQLISDPFAYIFQRRSPLFEPTRIEIDGVETGSWAPEGIGHMRSLRSLRYGELSSAYEQKATGALMRSLN